MPLRTGDTVGAYEILESIGKGGMGEVFRARDPRMGRDVAIKTSIDSFPERFSREVHAVAALNHANVCTVYDVGPDYLVMELVEGPTLAERIAEGPIPMEEALAIARQIGDALEAAHERGIVHRDLKPGNIKLTPRGTVKVLDFGLAKFGGTPVASTDLSPTLSMQATQAGVILGTAAYMAPEQARGKAVDRRADIWAFGVVLHEMVTGTRLFEGEDLTETLASVVKVEPDLSTAPVKLRRLLMRCLQKDPSKRLRHIGDAWDLLESDAPAQGPAPAASRGFAAAVPWALAALLLASLAGLAFVHFRESPPDLATVQFAMEPPPDASFANIYGAYAPSPDGRHIVFGASARQSQGSQLWLRSLDSTIARPLRGTDGGNFPAWSPDGRSIVFFADGKLRRMDIEGGSPFTLADALPDPVTPTGSWNRDGVILFGSSSGLWRVSTSGGDAALLTTVGKDETGHGYPQFLPDGRRFLFFLSSLDPNQQGVYLSALDTPAARTLVLRTGSKAVYLAPRPGAPGRLLWMQDETLLAQEFDPDTAQRTGDMVSIAEGIGVNPANPMRAAFWASDAGLLTYFSSTSGIKRKLVWMSPTGAQLGDAIPENMFLTPALAPDANHVAVAQRAAGAASSDIWVWDLGRQTMTRITSDPAEDSNPVWSPASDHVAFSSSRDGGRAQIFRRHASGTGPEERLTEGRDAKVVLDWSRDGKYLLYRTREKAANWDLAALPLEGNRKPIMLVQDGFNKDVVRMSPNGVWFAYKSNETGRSEIYIQAFPVPGQSGGPTGKVQISNTGASDMSWRMDSRELYYETLDGNVMAVAINAGQRGIEPGTPRRLFAADIDTTALHSVDATADGSRFLVLMNARADDNPLRLSVISNWAFRKP